MLGRDGLGMVFFPEIFVLIPGSWIESVSFGIGLRTDLIGEDYFMNFVLQGTYTRIYEFICPLLNDYFGMPWIYTVWEELSGAEELSSHNSEGFGYSFCV